MAVRRVKRSVLLSFPAAGVYGLVGDVGSYPEFLPWCTGSDVIARTEDEVVAGIDVHFHGHRERVVTRNSLTPHRAIVMNLIEGPFRHFEGRWAFTPLGQEGCRAELDVAYEFASRLLGLTVLPFVGRLADDVLDAFAARARQVLGR